MPTKMLLILEVLRYIQSLLLPPTTSFIAFYHVFHLIFIDMQNVGYAITMATQEITKLLDEASLINRFIPCANSEKRETSRVLGVWYQGG